MANRLYFRYGTMGSSKSAQALMVEFNYRQKGMNVMLIKPSLDNRGDNDGKPKVRSRIGLEAECFTIKPQDSVIELFEKESKNQRYDCIIIDEAQFLTEKQVEQCKYLTQSVPVLCYGLLVDFKCRLFEGTKRLVELADSMQEIKSVCKCGRKATVNARFINGKCVDDGPTVFIGGDEAYENMCYWCWQKALEEGRKQ